MQLLYRYGVTRAAWHPARRLANIPSCDEMEPPAILGRFTPPLVPTPQDLDVSTVSDERVSVIGVPQYPKTVRT